MRHYGLIGYPLEHSFSVRYFTEKFRKEEIGADYRNFPLEGIYGFSDLLEAEPDLLGLNVTVPYKQEIIPYLDALSQTARNIGAVNTIGFCRSEDRLALVGHNTDVMGFERSLKEHLKKYHDSALVLGTGGSSRAVTFVLQQLGIDYRLVSRNAEGERISYQDLGKALVSSSKLIINTTPLGMFPRVDECPEIPYDAITAEHLLFDLIYNPEKTLFLSKGEERGATVVNGYQMLVYQAEGSWDIWNRIYQEEHKNDTEGGNG